MNNQLIRALRVKSFLFLWLAEFLSQIAVNMMNFILVLVAYSLTNSNKAVSGVVLSFTLPAIIFGLLAGVYVDRWNKRYVLITTNVLRAVLVLGLAFLHTNLIVLYSFSFLITVATQFFIPAETPIIPSIVGRDLIFSANALFGIALYGSLLIAYGLSGPIILAFGITNAFIILSILFFIAMIFTLFVRYTPKAKNKEKENELAVTFNPQSEIKAALKLIVKIKDIYNSFFLLTILQVLVLIIAVIGPGYAKQILHININQFPILFVTPAAIGMVLGAIFISHYFHNKSRHKTATLGLLICGITFFLLPYGSKVASREFVHSINVYLPHILRITILHIMVFLAFIMGFACALIFVPSNTILQEQTSDEIRGKIYGALNAIVSLVSLIPIIITGSLADIFGVKSILIGIGAVITGIGIFRIIKK